MSSDPSQTMPLGEDAGLRAVAQDYAQAVESAGEPPPMADWLARVAPAQRGTLIRRMFGVAVDHWTDRGVEDWSERLLAANPELSEELGRLLGRDAPTTGHFLGNDDTGGGSSTGLLRVRCPHCRNPIEVVADADLDSVACPSCGSDFGLADDPPTRVADPARSVAHFDLVERVGTGAFGEVWKAHDRKLDRTVAVKIPRRGMLDQVQQKMFLREAQNAAQLSHPRIVPVYEVGRDGDTLYIVSDFVRGLSLADWLSGQSPTTREAAEYARQIAEALQHAHERGVVHRDLKPGNVMLDPEGGTRLMDFGLARRDAGAITMTRDGQVLGTPAYMSPEQARGDAHAADRRSDVYSLGVILFELLTGERPFRGNERMLLHQVIHDEPPSPRKLNATVPRDLETITLKCLDKDPDRRYATAGEVEAELTRWLGGHAIESRPIPTTLRAIRWCRRNPWPAVYTLTIICFAMAALISYSVMLRQDAIRLSARLTEEIELRKRIDSQRLAAEDATASAERAVAEAERAQVDAETMSDLCLDLLEIPGEIGRESRVDPVELLVRWSERSTDRIQERLDGSPRRGWRLVQAMSRSMYAVDEYERAATFAEQGVRLARAGWGPDSAQVFMSQREELRAKMRRSERTPGFEPLLSTVEDLAKEAQKNLSFDAVASVALAADAAYGNYLINHRKESLAWADSVIEHFLKVESDSPLFQEAAFKLGFIYCIYSRYEDGVRPFEEFLRLSRELDGPLASSTLQALHANLAWALTGAGLHDRAIAAQREALALFRKKYPNDPSRWLWPAGHLIYRNLRGGHVQDAQEAAEVFLSYARAAELEQMPREVWTVWMLYHKLLADGEGAAAETTYQRLEEIVPWRAEQPKLLLSELSYLDKQGRPAEGDTWTDVSVQRLHAIREQLNNHGNSESAVQRAEKLIAIAEQSGKQ